MASSSTPPQDFQTIHFNNVSNPPIILSIDTYRNFSTKDFTDVPSVVKTKIIYVSHVIIKWIADSGVIKYDLKLKLLHPKCQWSCSANTCINHTFSSKTPWSWPKYGLHILQSIWSFALNGVMMTALTMLKVLEVGLLHAKWLLAIKTKQVRSMTFTL